MNILKTLWNDRKKLSAADGKWVAICSLIYLTFLLLDVFNPGTISSAILKYTGIFLCVVYAFSKHHRDTALGFALLLTLLSDTFLVWTQQELLGVMTFCIAQFIHLYRFKRGNQNYFGVALLVSFLAMVVFYHGKTEMIYLAAMFYAILLATNFILSAKKYHKSNSTIHDRFGFYGFCLFVCCDICVAIRHVALDGIIPNTALPLLNFLIWFFYYPSQVFIASSSNLKTKESSQKACDKIKA